MCKSFHVNGLIYYQHSSSKYLSRMFTAPLVLFSYLTLTSLYHVLIGFFTGLGIEINITFAIKRSVYCVQL